MKNKWYAALLLTVGIGMLPITGVMIRAEEPVLSKAEATPVMAASDSKDEKENKKESKEESKKEIKEKETEKLFPINEAPLGEEDFRLHEIALGDSIKAVTAWKGKAKEIRHGSLADTYVWDDLKVRVYPAFLDAYNQREDISLGSLPFSGISEWEITGDKLESSRGIHVGSLRENVLRVYGKPDQISWDGEKQLFYFSYKRIDKNLTFSISQDMVKSIRISFDAGQEMPEEKFLMKKESEFLPEKDFSLAGLSLHQPFKEYSFMEWEKKMTNPKEEIWYYKGYGVRMTKKEKWICGFFLTDNHMLTPRGLALGDDAATAELLYGPPHKLELDSHEGTPRTACIYFSKGKELVLLIYLKNKKVDSIAVAENPQRKE